MKNKRTRWCQPFYNWEQEEIDWRDDLKLTKETTERFARRVLTEVGHPILARALDIRFPNNNNWHARAGTNFISLPPWARTRPTILHELAHILTPTAEGHGPVFTAWAMKLWSRYLGIPMSILKRSATDMGISYDASVLQ